MWNITEKYIWLLKEKRIISKKERRRRTHATLVMAEFRKHCGRMQKKDRKWSIFDSEHKIQLNENLEIRL